MQSIAATVTQITLLPSTIDAHQWLKIGFLDMLLSFSDSNTLKNHEAQNYTTAERVLQEHQLITQG